MNYYGLAVILSMTVAFVVTRALQAQPSDKCVSNRLVHCYVGAANYVLCLPLVEAAAFNTWKRGLHRVPMNISKHPPVNWTMVKGVFSERRTATDCDLMSQYEGTAVSVAPSDTVL